MAALLTIEAWTRVPFTGAITVDDVLTGAVEPGGLLAGHPYGLGVMSDGKIWVMGLKNDTEDDEPAIVPLTSDSFSDVSTNGWTDVGFEGDGAFALFRNGAKEASYDTDAGKDNIIGFPVGEELGPGASDGTPGVVVIPVTATSWAGATFVPLDDSSFRPDAVVSDNR